MSRRFHRPPAQPLAFEDNVTIKVAHTPSYEEGQAIYTAARKAFGYQCGIAVEVDYRRSGAAQQQHRDDLAAIRRRRSLRLVTNEDGGAA